MVDYGNLTSDLEAMPSGSTDWHGIIAKLANRWVDDYARSSGNADIVETEAAGFCYLFDIFAKRLIAAWGLSQGRHSGDRDNSRMSGHPLSAGPLFHRGHAIPHRLGGGADINLVPQLGSVNVGDFRKLENLAVKNAGALYFTYWQYLGRRQTPFAVDQGLLIAGQSPNIRHHGN
jgi:hypothetical protein